LDQTSSERTIDSYAPEEIEELLSSNNVVTFMDHDRTTEYALSKTEHKYGDDYTILIRTRERDISYSGTTFFETLLLVCFGMQTKLVQKE